VPQSIGDWDQAFASFCGRCMFLYEVGLDAIILARDGDSVQRTTRVATELVIHLNYETPSDE
jgi:hypothetical protein